MKKASIVLACVAALRLSSVLQAEQLVVDLASGYRDPVIEIVSPPPGSDDRLTVTSDGILVVQKGDIPGKSTANAGFKMLLAAKGDFTVSLDAEIQELKSPTAGWGQGLVFEVDLDDANQTKIKLNRTIKPSEESAKTMMQRVGKIDKPLYQSDEGEFSKGRLTIQRRADKVYFLSKQGDSTAELGSFDCPTADIRGVAVWSTRQASGNTPAKMLFKQLSIDVQSFQSSLEQPAPFFTWYRILIVANVMLVGVLAFVYYRNKASET